MLKMDWAEELKMSIRKTTARKGRRSKSRDALKEEPTKSSTNASSSTSTPHFMNKDISIDITLDMNKSSTTVTTSGETENEGKRPPPLRRISGGWADAGLKGLKFKKNSMDDERFQLTSSVATDDIPVIPDLEDFKDDTLVNDVSEPYSITANRVAMLKELNSDLLAQHAFTALEDLDLSILARCLKAPDTLDEPDEVWEWDKLFTQVAAEINADDEIANVMPKKIEIGPDEIPPTLQHT